MKAGRFADAAPRFEQSYAFFNRHLWLDLWRALVMLSGGAYGYREMALTNQAFCYSQIGEAEQAIETYRRILRDNPDNTMARTALRSAEIFRQLDPR